MCESLRLSTKAANIRSGQPFNEQRIAVTHERTWAAIESLRGVASTRANQRWAVSIDIDLQARYKAVTYDQKRR